MEWAWALYFALAEVEIRPCNVVDAQFAYDYGEDGRTLEQWRVACWARGTLGVCQRSLRPNRA